MTTPAPRPIAILACGHWVDRLDYYQLGGTADCPECGEADLSFPRQVTVVILDFGVIDQGRIEQARRLRANEEALRPVAAFCDAHVGRILSGGPGQVHRRPLTDEEKLADLFQPIDDGHELTRLGDGK